MIGHNDKEIKFYHWSDGRCIAPLLFNESSQVVLSHDAVGYVPEQMGKSICADGDKIYAWLSVIIAVQAR